MADVIPRMGPLTNVLIIRGIATPSVGPSRVEPFPPYWKLKFSNRKGRRVRKEFQPSRHFPLCDLRVLCG